jgi:Fe-S-cluster-containing hydrogenase component 2
VSVLDGVARPLVSERRCVGCGTCEWVCPVEPLGAIRVNSGGDRRHWGRAKQRAHRESPTGASQEGDGASPYPGQ